MVDTIKVNPHHYTDLKGVKLGGTLVTATAAEINELDASVVGAVVKLKTLPITIVANTDEQDTGWDLPAKCAVLDCWLDVTTLEATGTTKTVDVGTLSSDSGDADGFLVGASVAAAAVVQGVGAISGTGANAFWDTTTRGALLAIFQQGAAGDADNGGTYAPHPCTAPGSRSVTYTLGHNDFAELVANICILYVEIA